MKINKKALILALSVGLLVPAVMGTKSYATEGETPIEETEIEETQNEEIKEQIENEIAKLEQAKEENIKAHDEAFERVGLNKTDEQREVFDKSSKLQEKIDELIEELKAYEAQLDENKDPEDNKDPDEEKEETIEVLKYKTITTYQGNRPVKETRVKQEGKDGYIRKVNGEVKERVEPQDEIIESLVMTKDAWDEKKEVKTPIYEQITVYRAWAEGIPKEVYPTIPEGADKTPYYEYKIFESLEYMDAYKQARDYTYANFKAGTSSFGNLDMISKESDNIIDYEVTTETVHHDAQWQWL